VQDYYLAMRLNDLRASLKSLYRLFIVSVYLKNVKIPNKGTPHDYPKMILSYLLVLEYWRSVGHVSIRMMKNNTMIVDEEFGEMCFGVLARCVLGDTCKSSFEHVSKMFQLLPMYRGIKDEINKDTRSNSIAWRHKVKPDSEEVAAASIFFKRTIKQIVENKYKSYDGSPASLNSAATAAQCTTTDYIPLIVDPQVVVDQVPILFAKIDAKLTEKWMNPHKDLWPHDQKDEGSASDEKEESSAEEDDSERRADEWGAPWEECIVGHYAVKRAEMSNGKGIEVYKIVELNEPALGEDGDLHNNFTGYQRNCSISNVLPTCFESGKWNHIPGNVSMTGVVQQYEVIAFFKDFNYQRQLPGPVKKALRAVLDTEQLFVDRRAQ
jgi:hypothetical protein